MMCDIINIIIINSNNNKGRKAHKQVNKNTESRYSNRPAPRTGFSVKNTVRIPDAIIGDRLLTRLGVKIPTLTVGTTT